MCVQGLKDEEYTYLPGELNMNSQDYDEAWGNVQNGYMAEQQEEDDALSSFGSLNLDEIMPMSSQELAAYRSDSETETTSQPNEVRQQLQINQGPSVSTTALSEPPIPSIYGLPPHENWKGKYNFSVSFQPQKEKIPKGADWTYSSKLKKLFISFAKGCPVQISTTGELPANIFLRATPFFTEDSNRLAVVKRCLHHSNPNEKSNVGHSAPEYFIRTSLPDAYYQTERATGRMSTCIKLPKQQPGSEFITIPFHLMCLNTCTGGIDRRPIYVAFTLEFNGEIVGRSVVDVKVCAAPGRDRRNEENKLEPTSSHQLEMPRKRKHEDGKSEYVIKVKSKEHYDILKRVAAGLVLVDLTSRMAAQSPQLKANDHVNDTVTVAAQLPTASSIKKEPV